MTTGWVTLLYCSFVVFVHMNENEMKNERMKDMYDKTVSNNN